MNKEDNDKILKLGIIGSRKRNTEHDKQLILDKVKELNPDVIISGGCAKGADKFAESIAEELEIDKDIKYPDIKPGMNYLELCKAYYARNKLIAENCDILIALVAPNRKGGTENTIKYFLKCNNKNNLIIL